MDWIDGDTGAIERQARLMSDVGNSLGDSSRLVDNAIVEGVAQSSGSWSHALSQTGSDLYSLVGNQVLQPLQQHSDDLHMGGRIYDDVDVRATQKVHMSYGVLGQI